MCATAKKNRSQGEGRCVGWVFSGCSSLSVTKKKKLRAPYDRRGCTASLAHHRQWGTAPLHMAWVSGGAPTRVTGCPKKRALTLAKNTPPRQVQTSGADPLDRSSFHLIFFYASS
jgi:hypothetical protein